MRLKGRARRMHPPMGQLQQNGRNRVVFVCPFVPRSVQWISKISEPSGGNLSRWPTIRTWIRRIGRLTFLTGSIIFFLKNHIFCRNQITDATSRWFLLTSNVKRLSRLFPLCQASDSAHSIHLAPPTNLKHFETLHSSCASTSSSKSTRKSTG